MPECWLADIYIFITVHTRHFPPLHPVILLQALSWWFIIYRKYTLIWYYNTQYLLNLLQKY